MATNMKKHEKYMINTLATNMRKPTRKARIVARSKILPPIIIALCKDRAVEYFKVNVFVDIYSWPNLVVPYTEELISRPFVDEN